MCISSLKKKPVGFTQSCFLSFACAPHRVHAHHAIVCTHTTLSCAHTPRCHVCAHHIVCTHTTTSCVCTPHCVHTHHAIMCVHAHHAIMCVHTTSCACTPHHCVCAHHIMCMHTTSCSCTPCHCVHAHDIVHTTLWCTFGVWICMYKKHRVDWKGLTIFNNQISFLSNESVNFQLCYQIVPVSVPWIQFLTLWKSCWMCGLYLQGIAVWSERVNY